MTITIDEAEQDRGVTNWTVALLASLGVVLLCCGLMIACRGRLLGEVPRIQSVRAEIESEGDELDQWSMVSEVGELGVEGSIHDEGLRRRTRRTPRDTAPETHNPGSYLNPTNLEDSQSRGFPEAQGLSRRTRRDHNYTDPVLQSPRTYLTQSNLEEPGSQIVTGNQGLSRNPQGPRNLVDPTPENPTLTLVSSLRHLVQRLRVAQHHWDLRQGSEASAEAIPGHLLEAELWQNLFRLLKLQQSGMMVRL